MTAITFWGGCHWGAMGFQGTICSTTVMVCNGSIGQKKGFLPCLVEPVEGLPGEAYLDPLANIS